MLFALSAAVLTLAMGYSVRYMVALSAMLAGLLGMVMGSLYLIPYDEVSLPAQLALVRRLYASPLDESSGVSVILAYFNLFGLRSFSCRVICAANS